MLGRTEGSESDRPSRAGAAATVQGRRSKEIGNEDTDQTSLPVRSNFVSRLLHMQEIGIIGALIIMVVSLTLLAPGFSSPENILNDARNLSFLGIVVLGQTMVMITGGIDLSVGSVWGMTAVTSAAVMAAGFGVIPPACSRSAARGWLAFLTDFALPRFECLHSCRHLRQ